MESAFRSPVARVALTLALIAPPLLARGGEESLKLVADPSWADARLGVAVAISGNTAAVGTDMETVHLFDLTTGLQTAELRASDWKPNDGFGRAVAIDGSTLLVGAKGGPGAYVFDVATGAETTKLLPGDSADFFGQAVAIDGNLAVVGAPGDDDQGFLSGSAFVFDLTTGQQIAKLLPSDGAAQDLFGSAVALSGTTVVVGAPGDDDHGPKSGSVYVFDASTGQRLAKLLPADASAGDNFGYSVAVDGPLTLVGTHKGSIAMEVFPHAYVFDTTTGQQLQELRLTLGADFGQFGTSVALQGTTAVVGAPLEDEQGDESGAAFVYDALSGRLIAELRPSDGDTMDYFGMAVAVEGSTVVAGSPWDTHSNLLRAGSAYVFDIGVPLGASYCGPAVPNSTGLPAAIAAFGSDVAGDDCAWLVAYDLPPKRFALFLDSLSTGSVNPPGSQGNLCLGGSIGRFKDAVGLSGPDGQVLLPLDLTALPTPKGPVVVQPGETWYFQAWFRDKNPTPTSNFTDGVGVTFQ